MVRALAAVHVLQQDADEHRESDILIVEKGAQAAGGLAVSDQPLLPEEQQRRKRALIKGPKEFRDIREDLPKGKAKS